MRDVIEALREIEKNFGRLWSSKGCNARKRERERFRERGEREREGKRA